jgi:hypothetical protein
MQQFAGYLYSFARLATFAAIAALTPAAAHATDYTDLWWTPTESGWGVNVVQSDAFMFLTFFIYGPDNKPTWYTAQLSQDAQGAYSGGLYLTGGTHYAKPWNPADSPAAQVVGTAQFRPSATNAYEATLTYVVNGVGTVVKAIERQPLTLINVAGSYSGGLAGVQSGCSNSGSYRNTYDLQVTQQASSGAATFTFTFPTYTCTLSGTLVLHGSQYTMTGAEYKCSQGGATVLSTSADLAEIKATAQGIEGRWAAPVDGGCTENAYFSAVLL